MEQRAEIKNCTVVKNETGDVCSVNKIVDKGMKITWKCNRKKRTSLSACAFGFHQGNEPTRSHGQLVSACTEEDEPPREAFRDTFPLITETKPLGSPEKRKTSGLWHTRRSSRREDRPSGGVTEGSEIVLLLVCWIDALPFI